MTAGSSSDSNRGYVLASQIWTGFFVWVAKGRWAGGDGDGGVNWRCGRVLSLSDYGKRVWHLETPNGFVQSIRNQYFI